MDEVTWAALTVVLTVAGGGATWLAYRRRGLPSGLFWAALTLLVPAAYLTRTLRMFTQIGDAVVGWATSLVLSPAVWIGIVLAGVAIVLLGTSRALGSRGIGARGAAARRHERQVAGGRDQLPEASSTRTARGGAPGKAAGRGTGKATGKATGKPGSGEPAIDDDLADIEAILRKRGIS